MNSPISPEIDDDEDRIKVCVRIRPLVRNEKDLGEILAWQWENASISPIKTSSSAIPLPVGSPAPTFKPMYTFDHLFYPENSNKDIFDLVVKGVVTKVMNGFHGAVFTYGQTSSGKTFTMTGNNSQPGVIPQAIQHCFDSIYSFKDREFLVRVSYLEIYNEQVKDLLNSEPAMIKIQHDPKTNLTSLVGVKEQVVGSYAQTLQLIKSGETLRHVGATDMNEKSSRAHTLFRLTIESKERDSNAVKVSSLNLVDLAGSENAKQTNSKGDRALEARYINQSLLTLSTIIHKLSEEKDRAISGAHRRQHLPYRDSKLTRILQPSLDGNAHIAVVCTISPTLTCLDETHNTLKFATRAKSVRMNAKVNEVMDEKTLLKVYREEIEHLKAKLFELEMQNRVQIQATDSFRSDNSSSKSDPTSQIQDDEEQEMILQMISEMERMILKAGKPAVKTSDIRMSISPSKVIDTEPSPSISAKSPIPTPVKTLQPESNSSLTSSTSSTIKVSQKASPNTKESKLNTSPKKQPVSRLSKVSNMITGKLNESASTTSNSSSTTTASVTKVAEKRGSRLGFGFKSGTTTMKTTISTTEQPSAPAVSKSVTFDIDPVKISNVSDNKESDEDENKLTISNTVDISSFRRPGSIDGSNRASPNLRASLQRVQSFRGDDVGDKVLFGVSKMLSALKLHIGRRPSTTATKKSDSDNNNLILDKRPSTATPDKRTSVSSTQSSSDTIERLELTLRLKEADNRFLQDELEKKDKMLAMLTEGLREVESSQQEWLAANEELSRDLETALNDNDWLLREIDRLKQILIANNINDFDQINDNENINLSPETSINDSNGFIDSK